MSARIRETFDFNRRQVLSAGLFTALTLVVSPAWGAGPASFIVYGGDILTMEGEAPAYVEALVIQDGLIVFAGSKLEALNRAGAQPKEYDLKGKTLMPGFIDPHLHPVQGASMLMPKYATPFDWKFPWGNAPAVRGHDAFLEKKSGATAPLCQRRPSLLWSGVISLHFMEIWNGRCWTQFPKLARSLSGPILLMNSI
ncbi:MAG: hypothetical protein IPL91_05115 [Hyphomicrobium sp.]|nr:hypothetical protein [Hyphomicrobium sp.]